MTPLSLVFVLTLGASGLITSDALLPHKCSLMEYMSASAECIREYTGVTNRWIATSRMSHPWTSFMKATAASCREGLFDRWLACKSHVDKMCEYRLISDYTLKKIIDSVCDKMGGLEKLHLCFMPWRNQSSNCIADVKFQKTAVPSPLCSLTKDFRRCVNGFFELCNPEERGAVREIMDAGLNMCPQPAKKESGKCPLAEYGLTSFMCWITYAFKFTRKYGSTFTMTDIPTIFCDSDLQEALACQEEVDAKCQVSLVNVTEARRAVNNACTARERILDFPRCVDPRSLPPCLVRATGKEQSICEMLSAVRVCYQSVFRGCNSQLNKTVMSLYDVIVPSPCSQRKAPASCSAVEHLGNVGLCWLPPIVPILTNVAFQPQHVSYGYVWDRIKAHCADKTFARSLTCQRKIDDMCKARLVRADRVKAVSKAVCDHVPDIKLVKACLEGSGPLLGVACAVRPDKAAKVLDTKEKLCRRFDFMAKCVSNNLKGGNCTVGSKAIINTLPQLGVPAPCASSTFAVLSYLVALSVVAKILLLGD